MAHTYLTWYDQKQKRPYKIHSTSMRNKLYERKIINCLVVKAKTTSKSATTQKL